MCYDRLKQQRQILVKERRIEVVYLTIGLLFVALFSALGIAARSIGGAAVGVSPWLLLVWLSMKVIKRDNRWIGQLDGIEKNGVLNETTEHTLDHPKVRFLRIPGFHATAYTALSSGFYGIKLIDAEKNQYVYFFEETLRYDKASIERLRDKFKREVKICCYGSSSIVKTIQNDPKFLHIRYGELCK